MSWFGRSFVLLIIPGLISIGVGYYAWTAFISTGEAPSLLAVSFSKYSDLLYETLRSVWLSLAADRAMTALTLALVAASVIIGVAIWKLKTSVLNRSTAPRNYIELPWTMEIEGNSSMPQIKAGGKALDSKRASLVVKLLASIIVPILLAGLFIVAIVYLTAGNGVREQLQRRGAVIATNLSDGIGGHVLTKNLLAIDALIVKYALLEELAYVYIENERGEILAHTFDVFPQQLKGNIGQRNLRETYHRQLLLQENTIYETRVPILEGQKGAVHVGIRGDVVHRDIYNILFPMVTSIALLVLAATACCVYLAVRLVRPLLKLSEVAQKMSTGDLETPVEIDSRDEVGELALSLERLRASLKAALIRLTRQKAS